MERPNFRRCLFAWLPRLHMLLIGVALSIGMSVAVAQTPPKSVITLVVPFAAAGTSDALARILSEPVGTALGQNILVDGGTYPGTL